MQDLLESIFEMKELLVFIFCEIESWTSDNKNNNRPCWFYCRFWDEGISFVYLGMPTQSYPAELPFSVEWKMTCKLTHTTRNIWARGTTPVTYFLGCFMLPKVISTQPYSTVLPFSVEWKMTYPYWFLQKKFYDCENKYLSRKYDKKVTIILN